MSKRGDDDRISGNVELLRWTATDQVARASRCWWNARPEEMPAEEPAGLGKGSCVWSRRGRGGLDGFAPHKRVCSGIKAAEGSGERRKGLKWNEVRGLARG